MIIFLNHWDRLFCNVFETPNNNNDHFTIIAIIGPTINRSDALLNSSAVSPIGLDAIRAPDGAKKEQQKSIREGKENPMKDMQAQRKIRVGREKSPS